MSSILHSIKKVFGIQSQIQEMVKTDVILSTGSQVLRAMKPHTPMIKFRGGASHNTTTSHFTPSAPTTNANPSSTALKQKSEGGASYGTLEHLELPSRYRRRPISEEEVAYINRGGPE